MSPFFRKIVAFFVSILAFFGININIEKPDLEIRGDGYVYSIDYEDRELDIEFPANPTTGFDWTYTMDGSALVLTKDEYDEDDNPLGVAGRGGWHEYEFKAVQPGDATLVFTYARSNSADAAKEFTVKISVDSSYEIKVVSFEKTK